MKTTKEGYKLLMNAAQYQPKALPKLLDEIIQQAPDQIFNLLSRTQADRTNALMLAVQDQPAAID